MLELMRGMAAGGVMGCSVMFLLRGVTRFPSLMCLKSVGEILGCHGDKLPLVPSN
jgi:hypothetical protein